jgi:hypothetical protein
LAAFAVPSAEILVVVPPPDPPVADHHDETDSEEEPAPERGTRGERRGDALVVYGKIPSSK